MADIIQVRRDTAANWTAENPTLAEGEIGLELDTGSVKFGDGVTDWAGLAYFNAGGGGGGAAWGSITGTLAAQTDLQAALAAKLSDAPSDGNSYARKNGAWATVASGGTGDVTGPASSVADRIAVFDGTSGKQIKDGGYTIAQLRSLALTTPENVQTGTAYTLVLADAFKLVAMSNADANTLTVPPNSAVSFPVGTRIDLSQDGAGQTAIVGGVEVDVRPPDTMTAKIRVRRGKATLIKRATNTWDLEGNLEAAP